MYCGYLFNKTQLKANFNQQPRDTRSSILSVTAAGIDYEIYFLTIEQFNKLKSKNESIYDVNYRSEFEYLFSGQLLFDYEGSGDSGYIDSTTHIEILEENIYEEISIDFKIVNESIESKINKLILDSLEKFDNSDCIFICYRLEKGLTLHTEFDHNENENSKEFFEENIKLISYQGFCDSFEFNNEEVFLENADFYSTKGEYFKLFQIKDLNDVDFFDFEE
jgi:hypothetical protein